MHIGTRIVAAAGAGFTPLMTCYLTDEADPDELARGFEAGAWVAAKLYPAGATTNSASGVTDVRNIYPALERMQTDRHGAVRPRRSHRSAKWTCSIARRCSSIACWSRLTRDFPDLKIVFEHITTAQAVGVRRIRAVPTSPRPSRRNTSSSTATPCSPAASGPTPIACRSPSASSIGSRCARRRPPARPNIFLGTDSAPHAREAKESACGCAGIFNAPFALESYASVFEDESALDRFEAFASEHGARFYGLPLNEGTVTLERTQVKVPDEIAGVVPFHAGETLRWRLLA